MFLLTRMKLEFHKKKSAEDFKASQKKIEEVAEEMEEIAERHMSIFNNSDYLKDEDYVILKKKLVGLQSNLYKKEERETRLVYDTKTHVTYVEDETGGIVIDGDTRLAGSFSKFLEKLEQNYLVVNIID